MNVDLRGEMTFALAIIGGRRSAHSFKDNDWLRLGFNPKEVCVVGHFPDSHTVQEKAEKLLVDAIEEAIWNG